MIAQPLRVALAAVIASLGLGAAAHAAHPSHHGAYCQPRLPVFGMHSYNNGYGEVIVRVRHGGLACQLGLEEGDVVTRLNHDRLTYHGSWEDALSHAMADGGHIVLRVRDGRTGRIVRRHVDLDPYGNVIEGPVGPITPKAVVVTPRVVPHSVGYRGYAPAPRVPHARRDASPRFTLRLGF